MKITPKLILSSLLCMFLPFSIFTGITCYRSVQSTRSEIFDSIQSTFEQSYASINNRLQYIKTTSFYFTVNSQLDVLTYETGSDFSIEEQIDIYHNLEPLLPSENFGSEITDTYVYLSNSFPILESSPHISSMEEIREEPWAQHALASNSFMLWIPSWLFQESTLTESVVPYDDRLALVRKIPNPDNYTETAILVRHDFRKSAFESLLANNNITQNSHTYITNISGTIITGDGSDNTPFPVELSSIGSYETNWQEITVDSRLYHVGMRQLSGTDWYFVSFVPDQDIFTQGWVMERQFLFLGALFVILSLFYICYIAHSITGRIQVLTKNMHFYNSDRFILIPQSKSHDEISTLIEEYNYLIMRIHRLNQEQELNQKELFASEMKLLRTQLNPHFLFNTLEMLRWYAHNHDDETVNHIIRQLSGFYRLSMNHGRDFYTVKDEIDLLQNYFNIMNMRYQNIMDFEICVDEGLYPYLVPIILLQPVLENAIKHGLLSGKKKGGKITLTAYVDDNSVLTFYVKDNGSGIDPDIMNDINQRNYHYASQEHHSGNGIGVQNLNNRIRLIYGEKYGLWYSAPDEGGTLVRITLSAQLLRD